MEEREHIKTLFIRLAEGDATAAEKEQISEYLLEGGSADDLPMPDELQAYGPQMTVEEADQLFTAITAAPVRYRRLTWPRVAAAAVLVGAIATLCLYWFSRRPADTLYTAEGVSKTVHLSDGSVVQLKAGSVLKVPGRFGKDKRDVEITGAAFFTVEADAGKPFIVHTPHAFDVEVLGTAFNVDARGGKAKVVLTRGSVKVMAATQKAIREMVLKPGEMADFDPAARTLSRRPVNTLFYSAWSDHLMTFRNETLAGVAQHIREEFGQELRFADPSLQQLVFTGYLSSADIRETIKTLEQTFDLQAQRINQTIILIQKKTK
ncbi:DUF4974 domain-containing protein [Chitinophaga lutea]|uniref:DUF4974 domain-containing protein n=1 Tax=Chitinophaga lutea TaxID=2488634 RepID=A0A3N4QA10_9BACT|nr:FecR domain-containing protein [Chitinophaga lutea]RPE12850.1 DUF4974 domain-containing protein [Chitinophaga lutea]